MQLNQEEKEGENQLLRELACVCVLGSTVNENDDPDRVVSELHNGTPSCTSHGTGGTNT